MTALPRSGHPFSPMLTPPRHFVGRTAELAVFEALLDGFLGEGEEPPVLVIEGRHGLGRSALLRECRARAATYGLVGSSPRLRTTWGWGMQASDTDHSLIFLDDVDGVPTAELIAAVASLIHETSSLFVVMAGLPGTARRLDAAGVHPADLALTLGPLSVTEASELLTTAAAESDETFDPAAQAEIALRAEGIPAFLQTRGEVLWTAAKESPISLADVRATEEVAHARIAEIFFVPALARATRAERAYLAAAAALAGPTDSFGSGEVEARILAGAGGRIDGGLRRGLLAKGLLYSPARGELAFAHPGMASYLRATTAVAS